MDPTLKTPLKASNQAKIAVFQRRSKDGHTLPGKIGSVKDVEIPPIYYCKCKELKSSCSICNEGWRQRSLPGLTLVDGKAVPCTTPHTETAPLPIASAGSSESIQDMFQSPVSERVFSPIRGDDPVLEYLDRDFDRKGLSEDYEAANEAEKDTEFPEPDPLITGIAKEMRVVELVRKLEEAELAHAATRTDLERERHDNAEALRAIANKSEESKLQMKQQSELYKEQLTASEQISANMKAQWITTSEETEAKLLTKDREVEVSKHEKEVLLRDAELQMKQQLEERELQMKQQFELQVKQQLEEREAQLRITYEEKQNEELAELRITLDKLREDKAATTQERNDKVKALAEERDEALKKADELNVERAEAEMLLNRSKREKANFMKRFHEMEKVAHEATQNSAWAEDTLWKAVGTLDPQSQAARDFLKDELDKEWWPEGFDPNIEPEVPKGENDGKEKEKAKEPAQGQQEGGTPASHGAPSNRPSTPPFPEQPPTGSPPDTQKPHEHSPGSGAGWGDDSKPKWGKAQSPPPTPERDDRWNNVQKPEWEKERDRVQAERDAREAAHGPTGSPPAAQPPSSSKPKSRMKREPPDDDPDDDDSSESSDEERKSDKDGEDRGRDYDDQDPPRGSGKDHSQNSGKNPGKNGPGGDDEDDDNGRKGNSDKNSINLMASAMLNAVEKMAEVVERSSEKGWKTKGKDDRKYHPKSLEANKTNIGHATIANCQDVDQVFRYKHIWLWRSMQKDIEKYLLLLYNSEDVGKNVWKAIQEGVTEALERYHKTKDHEEKMSIEPECNMHVQEEQVSRDLWLQLCEKFPVNVQVRVKEKKESHGRATGRLEDAVFLMSIWCAPATVPQKEDCRQKFSAKRINWETLESGKERLNIILIKWRQDLRVLEDCGAINKEKTSYEPFLRQLRESTKPGIMPDARVGDGFTLEMLQLFRTFEYDEDHVSQQKLDEYLKRIQTLYAKEIDLYSDTKPAYFLGRAPAAKKTGKGGPTPTTPPRKNYGTFGRRPWTRSPGVKSPAAATANHAGDDAGDDDYYGDDQDWDHSEDYGGDDQDHGDVDDEYEAQSTGSPGDGEDQEAEDHYDDCPESAVQAFAACEEAEEDPDGELQEHEYYCPIDGYHYTWGPDEYINFLSEPGFCYAFGQDPLNKDNWCCTAQWYKRCTDDSCRCKSDRECKNQGRDAEGKLFKCDHPGCPRPNGHTSKACRKKYDWLEKIYLRAKRELKGPPKGKGKGGPTSKGKGKGKDGPTSKGKGKHGTKGKDKDKRDSGKGDSKGKGKGGKKGATDANTKDF